METDFDLPRYMGLWNEIARQRVQAATDSGARAKADLEVATKAEADAQFADLQLKVVGFLVANNAPEVLITGALGVVQGLVAVGDLLVGIAPSSPPPAEVPVVAAPPAEVPVVTALPAADTAPVASASTSAPPTETPMADQPPVFSSPA